MCRWTSWGQSGLFWDQFEPIWASWSNPSQSGRLGGQSGPIWPSRTHSGPIWAHHRGTGANNKQKEVPKKPPARTRAHARAISPRFAAAASTKKRCPKKLPVRMRARDFTGTGDKKETRKSAKKAACAHARARARFQQKNAKSGTRREAPQNPHFERLRCPKCVEVVIF